MSTPEEQHAITQVLSRFEHPVIVELGAFCGEDSEWMREACNNQHALNVMVEPDARNCDIIRKHRLGIHTCLVEGCIADYDGSILFHQGIDHRQEGGRCGSGSIRNPAPHSRIFPEIRFVKPIWKTCYSLDGLVRAYEIPPIDLLWVDVQGAERDMIAGGQRTLRTTRYLFIEAEETELYEGQALRGELLGLLPWFRVIGEFDYNLLLEAL